MGPGLLVRASAIGCGANICHPGTCTRGLKHGSKLLFRMREGCLTGCIKEALSVEVPLQRFRERVLAMPLFFLRVALPSLVSSGSFVFQTWLITRDRRSRTD